ncbi:MAG: PQQ-like beta-propeller repeat protein [Methanomassiliicoccales archaeon]|nr:PQQ-like beta-propeller repeat protein [Methanomassiliicoccales archaeon]
MSIRTFGQQTIFISICVAILSVSFFGTMAYAGLTTDHMEADTVPLDLEVEVIMKAADTDPYALTTDGVYVLDRDGAVPLITGPVVDMVIGDCHGELSVLYPNGTVERIDVNGDVDASFSLDGDLDLLGMADTWDHSYWMAPYIIIHQTNATGERLLAFDYEAGSIAWTRELNSSVIEAGCDFCADYLLALYENGTVEAILVKSGEVLVSYSVDGTPLEMEFGVDIDSVGVIHRNTSYRLTVFDLQRDENATILDLSFDEPVYDLQMVGSDELPCVRNGTNLMIVYDGNVSRVIPLSSSGEYDTATADYYVVIDDGGTVVGYRVGREVPAWRADATGRGQVFMDVYGTTVCSYGEHEVGLLSVHGFNNGDRGLVTLAVLMLPMGILAIFFLDRTFSMYKREQRRMDLTGLGERLGIVHIGALLAFVICLLVPDGDISQFPGGHLTFAAMGAISVSLTLPFILVRRPASTRWSIIRTFAGLLIVPVSIVVQLFFAALLWGLGLDFRSMGIIDAASIMFGAWTPLMMIAIAVIIPIGLLGGRWVDKLYPKEEAVPDGLRVVRFASNGTFGGRPGELLEMVAATAEETETMRSMAGQFKTVFLLTLVAFPLLTFMVYANVIITVGVTTLMAGLSYVSMTRNKVFYEGCTEPIAIFTNGIGAFHHPMYDRSDLNGFIPLDRISSIELKPVIGNAILRGELRLILHTHDGKKRDLGMRSTDVAVHIMELVRDRWKGY